MLLSEVRLEMRVSCGSGTGDESWPRVCGGQPTRPRRSVKRANCPERRPRSLADV